MTKKTSYLARVSLDLVPFFHKGQRIQPIYKGPKRVFLIGGIGFDTVEKARAYIDEQREQK